MSAPLEQVPESEVPGSSREDVGISGKTSLHGRKPTEREDLPLEKRDPRKFRCCDRPITSCFSKASYDS